MKATLLWRERHVYDEHSFADLVIWRLPRRLRGSAHSFKYRLAYVVNGVCMLRYDNEAGKGDHRHMIGDPETPYAFSTPEQLVDDFFEHVERMRR
jgi:Family of unknown function (DUF6516)